MYLMRTWEYIIWYPCLDSDGDAEIRVIEREDAGVHDGEAQALELGDDHHQHSAPPLATDFQQDGVIMDARLNGRDGAADTMGAPTGTWCLLAVG